MNLVRYPAIDVRDGKTVRLAQGDYARQTVYADSPLRLARSYAAQGAEWLHLVDLDAAKAGGYTLAPLLAAIGEATSLKVQTGGGVRSRDDVRRILDAGASRVVIGSLSVKNPDEVIAWIGEFGADRITVALDTRQDVAPDGSGGAWQLPVHGWTERSGMTLDALARRYEAAGLKHLLCTDIARDGMLGGPNFALYAHIRDIVPKLQVQCSGGVSGIDDVRVAAASGCAGIVLGRALLEGRFTLEDALQC